MAQLLLRPNSAAKCLSASPERGANSGSVSCSRRSALRSSLLTVLAQCNTFLLHRIVNDADQNLVARLVPDNVGGLLRELPSLPSRQAILLGWAAPIPVLVEVDELPDSQRPQSADPDFWKVWTLAEERCSRLGYNRRGMVGCLAGAGGGGVGSRDTYPSHG